MNIKRRQRKRKVLVGLKKNALQTNCHNKAQLNSLIATNEKTRDEDRKRIKKKIRNAFRYDITLAVSYNIHLF